MLAAMIIIFDASFAAAIMPAAISLFFRHFALLIFFAPLISPPPLRRRHPIFADIY
jgi:hypothetical protein